MSMPLSFSKMVKSDFKRKIMNTDQNFPRNKFSFLLKLSIYIVGSKGFRSIFLYRLFNIKFKNVSKLQPLYYILRWISFSVEIPYSAQIEEGFLIGHPEGLVINANCVIGKNFTIYQGVTLGGSIGKIKDGRDAPFIGDNVFIGAGAKVLGPVKIGDNSMIGANAVVVKDIPKDSVAVGIPAKIVKKIDKPYIEIEKKYKQYLMEKKWYSSSIEMLFLVWSENLLQIERFFYTNFKYFIDCLTFN